MSSSAKISPTAHYTGEVWRRNGLSHPWLATREGRAMFDALHPLMRASGALGGPSLETYLLARHAAIDALLQSAIECDGVTQVIEIAAGMSPRGWRFANRYGERLVYVEADLPA
ncbi:MAG: class I SAM-dependent methyltransferase, partial [Solirubrobacteraceae bacterium]